MENFEELLENFGAATDHFGLADTLGTLVESSKVPVANSRVDAEDQNGDIAASAWVGNKDGELYEASCTYQVDTDAVALATAVKLGQKETGVTITGVDGTTSNSEWPKITVTGTLGTQPLEQKKTYTLPTITIQPKKQAQPVGFSVTTGKLTGSSFSATCDLATATDGEGEPVAHGVAGAVITATGEAVAISTEAPAMAAEAEWTATTESGKSEPQAAWHTASISVERVLPVTIGAGSGA